MDTPRKSAQVPAHVEMLIVRSTSVRAIGYDDSDATLYVRFANGSVYRIRAVPPHAFESFLAAPSKGRFYNERIRDAYADVSCLLRAR